MTTRIKQHTRGVTAIVLLAALALHAQGWLDRKEEPYVTLVSAPRVTVTPGRSTEAALHFRVRRGFHVNSSEPRSELLIPTLLTLKPPTDILIGGITYPPGKDMTFEFAPDEPLSVYEGDFTITARVRAATAASHGTFRVRGELKYQPCSDVACFPPAALPVHFDVRIPRTARRR
jgi:hypothetical protein